ncbi:MAG: hypothetical protein U9P70_00515 [Patescibacteria group bacterium]|nr:hypothetical protein [Patescibacteria group bacterium]
MQEYNIPKKIFSFSLFTSVFGFFSNIFLGIGMLAYLCFWFKDNASTAFYINPQASIIHVVVIFFGTIIIMRLLGIINQFFLLVHQKIFLESIINRNNSISHAFKVVLKQYFSFFRLTVYKLTFENIKFYFDLYKDSRLNHFTKEGGMYINNYITNLIISKSLLDEKPFTNFNIKKLYNYLFSKEDLLLKSFYLKKFAYIQNKKFFFFNPLITTTFAFVVFSFTNYELSFLTFILIFSFGFIVGVLLSLKSSINIKYFDILFSLKLLNYQLPKFNQIFFDAKNIIDKINENTDIKKQYNKGWLYFLLIFPTFFIISSLLVYLMSKNIISQFSMTSIFFFLFFSLAFFIFYKINQKGMLQQLYAMAAFFDKNIDFTIQEQKYISALKEGTQKYSQDEINKMPGSFSKDFKDVKTLIDKPFIGVPTLHLIKIIFYIGYIPFLSIIPSIINLFLLTILIIINLIFGIINKNYSSLSHLCILFLFSFLLAFPLLNIVVANYSLKKLKKFKNELNS